MKIAFLIPSLAAGGAERQLATLARELARRGEKVAVVVFYPGGALEAPLRHAGVESLSVARRSRFEIVGFIARLAGLLRAIKPDVIHGYMPTANLAALVMRPFLPGVRVVWGVRTSDVDFSRYGLAARIVYAIERLLARFPDRIVVNSFRGRDHYVGRGFPAGKLVVIPNGIDTTYFTPKPDEGLKLRAEWGIGPNEIVIGLAARLDPLKDHETFLRAAAIAAKSRKDLRFVCVGGGVERDSARLESLANGLGLENRVVWAGECHDMPAAYGAMDIATCSSIVEGFPNMVGEAMACGVPCVVTDVGDCARITADTGIVVPPRDPPSLAQAWLQLAARTPAERKALGRRARARIEDEFSVAALGENTLRALRFDSKP